MSCKLVPTSVMKLRSCLLMISLSKRHSQNYCIFVTQVLISRSSLRIRILIFVWFVHCLRFCAYTLFGTLCTKNLIIGLGSQGSEAPCRHCSSETTEEGHAQEPSGASATIRT